MNITTNRDFEDRIVVRVSGTEDISEAMEAARVEIRGSFPKGNYEVITERSVIFREV